MTPPDHTQDALDPVALLAWIDRVADRFEAAWADGPPPALAPFVATAPGHRRHELLKELVKIDLEHRWRGGDRRKVEDYLDDWPELRGPDGWLPDDLVGFAEELRQEFDGAGAPGSTATDPGGGGLGPRGPAERPRTLGKFQLGDLLGKGAFGAVYKARDTELDRVVAVKLPRAGFFATAEEQERFQREARSAGRLHHPGIVAVHEVGAVGGTPYIVSDYVEGRTLADRLAEGRPPFREAAALVAEVARALHYAHSVGVVHRDIKPSNILLDAGGRPYLADFGLAWRDGAELSLTADGQVLGTPAYMAPEQAEGRHRDVGPRSDVYSLGVVLYELLAGDRPFAGSGAALLRQVLEDEPPPLRRRDRRIPRDLETVCLKAMARAPGDRYASALEFANDLQRFLNDELVQARPAGLPRRFGRWCRRNPRVALLTGAVFVLLLAAVAAALESALVSRARAREEQREALVPQLERLRLTPHQQGWSEEAWRLARAAAALRADDDLRAQAAAACAGLDAHRLGGWKPFATSSLAFAPDGRLLTGGTAAARNRPARPARLWDGTGEPRPASDQPGPGAVAFRADGTPLQLLPGAGPFLVLRNLATGANMSTCPFPAAAGKTAPQVRQNDLDFPVLALSPGGEVLAAALDDAGPGEVAVWQGESGKRLCRLPGAAAALAFAADGRLLAAGDGDGLVRVWALPEGKPLASFPAGRTAVHCLAFDPDGRRLVVGRAGGALAVWDWRGGHFLTCSGAQYDVSAVAFSPDGTLLASGGRGPALLWDAASGHLLLRIGFGDYVSAAAFSRDGNRVAFSCADDGVSVWGLEHGCGIRTLRALTSPVARVCFSPDGRRLAALSHTWQVAVWDAAGGRLLRVLDAPRGFLADNAALAFDPGGRRLAFSTWRRAVLWDVDGGVEVRSWPLPPGLADALAFPAEGRLLLFREEARDRKTPPLSGAPPAQYPRVGRLRDLLAPDPGREIEVPEFDWAVHAAAAAPRGRVFVIEGIHAGPGGKQLSALAIDGLTGERLWSRPAPEAKGYAWVFVDPAGEVAGVSAHADGDEFLLLRATTGELVRSLPRPPLGLGPGARQLLMPGPTRGAGLHPGFALLPGPGTSPAVVLGIDDAPSTGAALFSAAGDRLAWGNTDGTVTLCDLEAVRARLAEVGLGW
jgi:WD40 repeat protein/tRNA A-37 threonylcarbamoyl transferase component Bud32